MSINYPSNQSPAKNAYFTKDTTQMRPAQTKSTIPSTYNKEAPTIKKQHPYSNQQSPYSYSPNPYASKLNYSLSEANDELDMYRVKCYDLENQLNDTLGELDKQRSVNFKSSDIEGRVGDVVVYNQNLQNQLEKATKHAIQRKTEADLWKQKYETQMSQLLQIKSNYELEIKSLSRELNIKHSLMGSMEVDKNRTISDSKTISDSQKHSHVETITTSQQNQVDMFEAQLKKLRDIIDDKTVQTTQLQTFLERQKAEYNDMQARLRNEIEGMNNRLTSLQIDHQKEVESVKNKLDLYKDTQVRNAQNAYVNQTDMMISEIDKLKKLLEYKNEEIETLLTQNQRQKSQQDLETYSLREDIQGLKEKLFTNENTHQQENHNIQSNLERMHNQELTNAKTLHEKQVQLLNQEISKLKDIINNKNSEIEKQLIEKAQQKDYYDGEIQRLVNTIQEEKKRYLLLEAERNREVSDLLQRIDRLNEQSREQERQLQSQADLLEQELRNLKDLLNHKQKEIDKNLTNYSQLKLDLEDQLRITKDELELVKLRAYENEKSKNQEIQDLKMMLKEQEQNAREKQKQLELQIDHLQYENGKSRDMYNNKSKECENVHAQKNANEEQLNKVEDANDFLIQKLNAFENLKNQDVNELRSKMDISAQYQFENLTKAYNTQVGILGDQIVDLQNRLDYKQREINEVVEKYSILDRAVLPEHIISQNMYNSRTGVPAEFVTNKAVHDVIVKSTLRTSSYPRKY